MWLESGILDHLIDLDGHPKPLSQIVEEVQEYSLLRTCEICGCKEKDAKTKDEYKNMFGWMGEVLCEFWLKTFGHKYGIVYVCDTSQNQFQRGYDFTGSSVFDAGFNAVIQVKMQSTEKSFTYGKLFTFLDEAKKVNSLPQYTVLMVPTSTLNLGKVLSYKDGFKEEYKSKIIYIGQNKMSECLREMPSLSGLEGHHEFFTKFRESLIATKALEI